MENYQAVRSGLDIGRSVADYWEQTGPNAANEQRTKRIRAVNDILQGRSAHTAETLLDMLGTGPQGAALRRDILDFLAQKERLDHPYTGQGRHGLWPSCLLPRPGPAPEGHRPGPL